MVYCIRKRNWMKRPSETKVFRNYAKYDPVQFGQDLKNVDWNVPAGTSEEHDICVDHLWAHFKFSFLTVADRHAPLIQKRVRGYDNCPWISSKIKQAIRQRDFYLRKARKANRVEEWMSYRAARNRVSKAVKKAKQTYNKKLVENHRGDEKAFWKTMKKILPGKRKSVKTATITVEGTACKDNKKIANGFNSFFATAVSRLRQSLGESRPCMGMKPLVKGSTPGFKFETITEQFITMT